MFNNLSLRTSSQSNDEDETESTQRYQDHIRRTISNGNQRRQSNVRTNHSETAVNRRTSFTLPPPPLPFSDNIGNVTTYQRRHQAAEEQLEEERRSFARGTSLAEERRPPPEPQARVTVPGFQSRPREHQQQGVIPGFQRWPSEHQQRGVLMRYHRLFMEQLEREVLPGFQRGLSNSSIPRPRSPRRNPPRSTTASRRDVRDREPLQSLLPEDREHRQSHMQNELNRAREELARLEDEMARTRSQSDALTARLREAPNRHQFRDIVGRGMASPATDEVSETEFASLTEGLPPEFVEVLRENHNTNRLPRIVYAPPQLDERNHNSSQQFLDADISSRRRQIFPPQPQYHTPSTRGSNDRLFPNLERPRLPPHRPQPPFHPNPRSSTRVPYNLSTLPPLSLGTEREPPPPSQTPSPHRLHLQTQYNSLIIPYTHSLHRYAISLSPIGTGTSSPFPSTNTLRPIGAHFMSRSLGRHEEAIELLERFILSRNFMGSTGTDEDRRNFEGLRVLLMDAEMRDERDVWRRVVMLHLGVDLLRDEEDEETVVGDGSGEDVQSESESDEDDVMEWSNPVHGMVDLEVEMEYEADEESMAEV